MAVTQVPPTRTVILNERAGGPGLLVRALWYLFVGWWLTGIVMFVTYLSFIVVIGIPVGLWLVNRIPTFLTLRPRRDVWQTTIEADGTVRHEKVRVEQSNLLVRLLWLVLVGWWLTGLAMAVAYFCMLTILLIPAGLMLVNRLPRILTLHRGYA